MIDISKDSGPLQVSNHLISILIVFIANYQNYDGRYLVPSGLINPDIPLNNYLHPFLRNPVICNQ